MRAARCRGADERELAWAASAPPHRSRTLLLACSAAELRGMDGRHCILFSESCNGCNTNDCNTNACITKARATQTRASLERGHPDAGKSKKQIRQAKSDKKKEERIGSDLMAALNEPSPIVGTTWSPSAANSSGATFGNIHGGTTDRRAASPWALPGDGSHERAPPADPAALTGAGDHAGAAAAHSGCEHALNRTQCGATGGPAAASAEDPKRALVHSLQNDLARMSVRLKRLEELLSS